MAKKKKNNNTWIVVSVVIVVAVALYVVSSYSGLLGTKTFIGNDKVATLLECSLSANNELEAKLTISGSVHNSMTLPSGSGLQAQNITWSVPESSGSIIPSTSVTDEHGVVRSRLAQQKGTGVPTITATYEGDKIRVDYRENTENAKVNSAIVEYGASSCEIRNAVQ